MTRSFHKTKETPIHCHTNAAGAVKTSPMKIKKQGAGKGSWGSTKDDIHDAKQLLDEGDLPPVNSPERENSMRKLSISSSTSSEASSVGGPDTVPGLTNGKKAEKIVEDDKEWVDEPVTE